MTGYLMVKVTYRILYIDFIFDLFTQGGVHGSASLTAYVLISMMECQCNSAVSQSCSMFRFLSSLLCCGSCQVS